MAGSGIGESVIYDRPASIVETMIHDELAPRILVENAALSHSDCVRSLGSEEQQYHKYFGMRDTSCG
jgi:hypothetical protein